MVRWLCSLIFVVVSGHLRLALADTQEPWRPTAGSRPGLSTTCHPQMFAQKFLLIQDHNQRAELLKNTVNQCQEKWRAGHPQSVAAEKRLRDLDQPVSPTQHFMFLDQRGHPQRGWMWLQTTRERRPAVVVACDFNCDWTQSTWLKRVIHHLYEEGPFHVVLVLSPESQTDPLWLAGGLAYGQSIYETGFWLQTMAPVRQRISGLQLMGEGWGAQGTLMALIYNQHNPIASDRNVFQGHLAICPVTDLHAAAQVLQKPINEAQAETSEMFKTKLMALSQSNESWRQWLSDWRWDYPFLTAWLQATLAQSKQWPFLKPFLLQAPRSEVDWLQANDLNYQGLGIKLPSWLVGSNQDPRFKWTEHGARLALQNQDPKKSKLRTQVFDDQSSCALGASMGWDVEGALWRSLLLGESHEIWPRATWPTLSWNSPTPALGEGEQHLEQHWSVNTAGETRLEFFISNASGSQIRSELIMVDTQDWPEELKPHAGSPREAWRFTRQLNVRLRLRDLEGKPLLASRESAARLTWLRWSSL